MKKISTVMTAVLIMGSLSGCTTVVRDQYGDTHPAGVGYYDQNNQYHKATPEKISPQAQDAWETAGWLTVGAAAIAGTALGIVALTK